MRPELNLWTNATVCFASNFFPHSQLVTPLCVYANVDACCDRVRDFLPELLVLGCSTYTAFVNGTLLVRMCVSYLRSISLVCAVKLAQRSSGTIKVIRMELCPTKNFLYTNIAMTNSNDTK